ncbi:uncharacterized protein LOC123312971 [Coccinella septempunctata]|uniref:uncharacterized protein LOC123312971 n=1 Tax=Coccinella septempunctata TaxID=41139 RepID=UPI001D083D4C|nr:uncharacterized protein LOC123312971 [Coccinella septempunctata]
MWMTKHPWMFEEASAEIIKLFPNEQKETYYIPYKKKSATSPKKAPKGRLWSRYHNVRNLLRITEKTTSTSKKILFREDTNGNEILIDHSEDTKNYQLLHTVLEPKTRVIELWKATLKFRKTHFKNLTIEEIFDEVPALKTDIGSELIDSEFCEKFPENSNNVYLKWPSLSNAILKESEHRKIKAVEHSADVGEYFLYT